MPFKKIGIIVDTELGMLQGFNARITRFSVALPFLVASALSTHLRTRSVGFATNS
jgi:hypothetical protein